MKPIQKNNLGGYFFAISDKTNFEEALFKWGGKKWEIDNKFDVKK